MKTTNELRLQIKLLEIQRNQLDRKIDLGIVDPKIDSYRGWIQESEKLTHKIWKLNYKLSKSKCYEN